MRVRARFNDTPATRAIQDMPSGETASLLPFLPPRTDLPIRLRDLTTCKEALHPVPDLLEVAVEKFDGLSQALVVAVAVHRQSGLASQLYLLPLKPPFGAALFPVYAPIQRTRWNLLENASSLIDGNDRRDALCKPMPAARKKHLPWIASVTIVIANQG